MPEQSIITVALNTKGNHEPSSLDSALVGSRQNAPFGRVMVSRRVFSIALPCIVLRVFSHLRRIAKGAKAIPALWMEASAVNPVFYRVLVTGGLTPFNHWLIAQLRCASDTLRPHRALDQ